MSDIRQWLDELSLGQYADAFEAEQVTLATLAHLSDAMLKELGLPVLTGRDAPSKYTELHGRLEHSEQGGEPKR